MSWAPKPLAEILVQSGRDRAGDQDLPVLSITMKHGLVDQSDKFKKRIASSDTSNYRIAYRNELVVGFPIDEGVLGFQTKYPAGIVSPAYDVWRLQSETVCHIPYLERYLRSSQARSSYASRMQGAVARRRSLTKADFLNLEVPFPPLEEQARIAHLLGKVEELIAQRRQHLRQLDDLLKSVFLEIFGDPVRNEKGWKIDSLSSYGAFRNGLNFGKGESGEKVRYLGVGDFKSKATLVDFGPLAFIDLNELPAEDHYLRDGDLVFVRSNGNRELVGRCISVYPGMEKAVFSGFCIRYRIANSALQAIYVAHLFRSTAFRRVLFQGGQGANIQNINQQILSGLPIPIPAAEVQSQFAAIVERVEVLKSLYEASLAGFEALYSVTSQKAYKGELDLSRLQFFKTPESESNEMTSSQPPGPEATVISLPESDLLLAAFDDREKLKALLGSWLQAYTEQLGDRAFSVDDFMRAAESSAEMTLPGREFELGADAYDLIKEWVFDALRDRRLEQIYPSTGIHVALRKARVVAEG
jgi:type I restriction enzyme S subunit